MPTYDSLTSRVDAGPLMPEDVSNAFLKGLNDQSAVLSSFTRVPVSRAQVRFPVLSALPVAYWVTGDTGLKQTTEVNWDNKYLNIEELATIVPVPEAVIDDSDQPIWDQVRPLCEQAAGRLIDEAVYFGTNAPASFPDDIYTASTAALNLGTIGASAGSIGGIVKDHSDVLSKVEADGYDPRSGVAKRTLRGLARQARNVDGDRFGEVTVGADTVDLDGVTYGFPMRGLWPASGNPTAIMYDPSEFVVSVRQDVTWKLLDQAVIQDGSGVIQYNLAQQDLVALRLVMRVGWQVANVINYDEAVEANRYPAGVLKAS